MITILRGGSLKTTYNPCSKQNMNKIIIIIIIKQQKNNNFNLLNLKMVTFATV